MSQYYKVSLQNIFFTPHRNQTPHNNNIQQTLQPQRHFKTTMCSKVKIWLSYEQKWIKRVVLPKKTRNGGSSSGGFGGAAVQNCPCGSKTRYIKCCGKLHKSAEVYAAATAEQVVRARYTAYARREVDFIIESTHPLNDSFKKDVKNWKKTLRYVVLLTKWRRHQNNKSQYTLNGSYENNNRLTFDPAASLKNSENCYDEFELNQCKILSENYEGDNGRETASVQFVADMIRVDTREKWVYMETSTFERVGKRVGEGAWLYKDGVIETPLGTDETESDDSVVSSWAHWFDRNEYRW